MLIVVVFVVIPRRKTAGALAALSRRRIGFRPMGAPGQRKVIVPDDATEPREYALPRGVHVNVHEGERVRAGEQLMDGPSNPHDILRVLGEKELQKYLVNEIQEVYRR